MSRTEDQLAELAFEAEYLINIDELEDARKIGQELIDAGKEYGFQVMAMADQMEENIDAALKWVEKGMMAHPDSWTLGMRIKDNGIGTAIVREELDDHYGLYNMRQRAENIGAECLIQSAPDQGFEISVILPHQAET